MYTVVLRFCLPFTHYIGPARGIAIVDRTARNRLAYSDRLQLNYR